MAEVEIRNLRARYGNTEALKGVSLTLPDGKLTAILGPSGCGKTTLLRSIAGFADYEGSILIEGSSCDDVPPHKRNIGLVFQDYALFPHKTVRENIAFGMRLRRLPRTEIDRRTDELIAQLQLSGLGDRLPSELSGGQRQRVALARALAINPKLLLLDEPLSALDKKLREDMQVELRQLQQRVGITTLFVTHDQEEALALADQIVVMNEGRIRQVGSPMEIYERPADHFVATFIGRSNIFEASSLSTANGVIEGCILDGVPVRLGGAGALPQAGTLRFLVRPERLRIVAQDSAVAFNRISGVVQHVAYLGARQQIRVAVPGGMEIDTDIASSQRLRPGEHVVLAWSAEDAVILTG